MSQRDIFPSRSMASRYNSASQTRSIPIQYTNSSPTVELYNTIDDNRVHNTNYADYEEQPESEYYQKLADFVHIPKTQPSSTTKSSLASPPLPPMINHSSTLQRLYYPETKKQLHCTRRFKLTACILFLSAMIILLIGAFLWHINNGRNMNLNEDIDTDSIQNYDLHSQRLYSNRIPDHHQLTTPNKPNKFLADDHLITANTLATLIVAKRKLCIFEVSTNDADESRKDFEEEHIEKARLLYFGNLSHSGIPVHPLQYQRYIRSLGVDSDCKIVLYDKGQTVWATYALWLFQLFGHENISLLNGGFLEYKSRSKEQSNLYKLVNGPESPIERLGNFRSRWVDSYIAVFDDLIANFETQKYELIDAQSVEEYEGKTSGAVFGHIRGAINLPIDEIFNWSNNTWPSVPDHLKLFKEKGISLLKPIIIYDGTSLRSSLIWFTLQRLNIESAIYFGSWPEFVIRAPDEFKIIPNGVLSKK